MLNPTLTGADWSFMPEISGETAAGKDEGAQGEVEEGEVTGEARVAEDVVVIDEPVTPVDNLQTEQPVPTDHQPTSVDNIFIFLWAWGCPYYCTILLILSMKFLFRYSQFILSCFLHFLFGFRVSRPRSWSEDLWT